MREHFSKVSVHDYGIISIYMGYRDGNDIYLLRNNTYEKIDPLTEQEPTIKISYVLNAQEPNILQSLLDGLIKIGITPTKPIENTSELKATKYHLEDLRKIVFKPRGGSHV